MHYTGHLNVKFMVQRQQWRKHHDDAHYAAAIYRYEWEFAVRFCDFSSFVCLDDKHKVKVGEPHCPLAAAERGRRVFGGAGATFELSDHDFSKFSIVPSVSQFVDIPSYIPSDISGSWYHGQVNENLKEYFSHPHLYGIVRNWQTSWPLTIWWTNLFCVCTVTVDLITG